MTQEELLKYKLEKFHIRRSSEELTTFIIELVNGSKAIEDIKAELIADKEKSLTDLEEAKTKLTSEIVELNK